MVRKKVRDMKLRPIDLTFPSQTQAFMEIQDATKIFATVSTQLQYKYITCNLSFAPFITTNKSDLDYSQMLLQAILPAIIPSKKTLHASKLQPGISINCLVLEADGVASALAAAITCTSALLAKSGLVEMIDLVSAVSCCSHPNLTTSFILDPDALQEEEAAATLIVSLMPSLNKISHFIQVGSFDENSTKNQENDMDLDTVSHPLNISDIIDTSILACQKLDKAIRKLILQSIK